MAIQIGALSPREAVLDAGIDQGPELYGAYGVATLAIGGATYVYVAAKEDDGLSVFRLGADGSLSGVQDIADGAATGGPVLDGATAISSATVGGVTYLYVASAVNHSRGSINVFQVGPEGTLTFVQVLTDTGLTLIEGIEGRMAVAVVGDSTFLVATGDDDDGVSVFRVEAGGSLTNIYNLADDATLRLDNAMDAIVAQVGATTFVFVAGQDDNGVSVFELKGDGTLASTANVADGGALHLQGAMGLATATVGGATYLIVSGSRENGLSVFEVDPDGHLSSVSNVGDSATRGLAGAQGLTTFVWEGETFVAVSGRDDDALSVLHLGAGGALTDATVLFGGVALDGTYHNAFASVGGLSYLIATSFTGNRVGTFEIGGGDDDLTGTVGADLLIGGRGDDAYLVDDAGDLVRESAGAGTDTVRAAVSHALGVHVEDLVLLGGAGLSGTGNGLADQITGNAGTNHLQEGGGDDALDGGAGQDEAIFSGEAADYRITQNGDGSVTVDDLRSGSPDGTDRLVAIERLRFADKVLNPDGTLADNDPPTDVVLRGGSVEENAPAGTLVARLAATDPDVLDRPTFRLDDPSGTFVVVGDEIRVAAGAAIDFESRSSYAVTITVDDGAGHSYREDAVLSVTDLSPVILGNARDNRLTGTGEADLIRGEAGDDRLSGLGGPDRLAGGDGRDRLRGGQGEDVLLGGEGRDRLAGGGDRDSFVFARASDSGATGASRDTVEDFTRADRLDLSDLDAVRGRGDQDFRLDRNGSFSAGEIRVQDGKAGLLLEMNLDGDDRPEMSLLLRGFHGALGGGDLLL